MAIFTASTDGPTHDLLAEIRTIDLGCIDVRDAEVEGAVDGAQRLGVVECSACRIRTGHRHGTETDAGNVEGSEVCVLHFVFSLA